MVRITLLTPRAIASVSAPISDFCCATPELRSAAAERYLASNGMVPSGGLVAVGTPPTRSMPNCTRYCRPPAEITGPTGTPPVISVRAICSGSDDCRISVRVCSSAARLSGVIGPASAAST